MTGYERNKIERGGETCRKVAVVTGGSRGIGAPIAGLRVSEAICLKVTDIDSERSGLSPAPSK